MIGEKKPAETAPRKFSDTLLICLLKAHHPDKYRENIKQTVEGGDKPVEMVFKWKS